MRVSVGGVGAGVGIYICVHVYICICMCMCVYWREGGMINNKIGWIEESLKERHTCFVFITADRARRTTHT